MQQDSAEKTPKIGRKPQDRVVIQALSMAFGTMTSRILGLLRDQAFAAMFSRTITDAWGVAFRLPNLFRRLLGEGSLSVSFIPVFIDARTDDPTGVRARNLVNGFYSVLLIVLGVLTALGILFAEPVVRLLVETPFMEIPGKFDLTVRMAQIMFGFIFLMSTYAFFMGILNALGQFALPAAAPTLFNIAMIAANFFPKEWQAVEGDALAWGVMVGGLLQTVILIPALFKAGYFPKLEWHGFTPDIARVWKNMIPGALGMGLMQITTIVNTNFASSLGEGSITYIYLADRLLELPLSLVSVSLGTALLPTLASLWAKGEREKTTETANYYLRLNLFVAVPAALGLYYLAVPIVELLFQRGKFTAADTAITASVVQVYAFTLIISSSVRVLVPSYYAVKNTWFPAAVSAVCLVFHIAIAPLLMNRYGIQGLVFSTLASASLNLISLMLWYPRFIGPLRVLKIAGSFVKFAVAGVVLALICLLYPSLYDYFSRYGLGVFTSRLLGLMTIIPIAGLAYCTVSYVLKAEELHHTLNSVLGKVRRRLKKTGKS